MLLAWSRDLFLLQRTATLAALPGPGLSLSRYVALAVPPVDAAKITQEAVDNGEICYLFVRPILALAINNMITPFNDKNQKIKKTKIAKPTDRIQLRYTDARAFAASREQLLTFLVHSGVCGTEKTPSLLAALVAAAGSSSKQLADAGQTALARLSPFDVESVDAVDVLQRFVRGDNVGKKLMVL